jgi:hypothetical protein
MFWKRQLGWIGLGNVTSQLNDGLGEMYLYRERV